MSTRRQHIMSAVIITAAIPALVAGCTPQPTGPSRAEQQMAMMAAVEGVPTVTGSLVGFSSAGVGASAISVKIYVDDVDATTLATTIDSVLGVAWKTSSFGPDHISISAIDGPKPANPQLGSIDGVDLTAVATTLGFDPSLISLDTLLVDSTSLAARYGAWVAPSSNG